MWVLITGLLRRKLRTGDTYDIPAACCGYHASQRDNDLVGLDGGEGSGGVVMVSAADISYIIQGIHHSSVGESRLVCRASGKRIQLQRGDFV